MAQCIIYNPNAGSSDQIRHLEEKVRSHGDMMLCVTEREGDARRMGMEAARRRDELVIAAGGDGTINEVVNGMMAAGDVDGDEKLTSADRPRLAILPLGTGNDLPRTLAIPRDDPAAAIDLIDAGRTARLDVIRVRVRDEAKSHDPADARYCVNVAAGGFSGQLKEVLTDEMKSTWGPLAYLMGAMKALPDLENYHTRIRLDGKPWQEWRVLNVVCANGRFTGGGTRVAPSADPEDGLIDVVLVKAGTAVEMARLAAKFSAGGLADLVGADYTGDDRILYERAKRVEIESDPGMWFNIDGELLTNRPVVFSAVKGAIEVIVGPEYRRAAE